ncbi:hypothetical protein ACFP3U_33145 [Kitasatospora misakiensis]|uniref:Uncharacterized protein n=1 Tax=Kitasatospora misakiensis TaxID=67330 RepID=A0ABW0XFD7_9ACTN
MSGEGPTGYGQNRSPYDGSSPYGRNPHGGRRAPYDQQAPHGS